MLARWPVRLSDYLHVTCIVRPGLKLETLGITLLDDAIQRRKPGDTTRSNLVSRRLQNNSERVTSLRPCRLADDATQGNPKAINRSQLYLTSEGNLTCCPAAVVWPS